ncbi:TRAP transporter small permease [Cellulosilyticum sp. I15G10I2]|uniref:TRAP transporter small permease n=1 Tax=Cellulosilyticum sp. I15G10I2 TaxID=1892843 RepID=UPI00085C5F0A|nr:TRAP transporter small permease subunit [Cellulosilyticum sp. I15G10I2]
MDKLSRMIYKAELSLGVLFISIFFVTIVIQVVGRYTGVTVSWTGEVSSYSFIWAVFMGAGAMTYENKHFSFASLQEKLTGRKRELINIFISLVIMLYSSATLYYGIIIAKKFWNYRWISLPSIKMGYTWLCVPILGGTCTLFCINHLIKYFKNFSAGGIK